MGIALDALRFTLSPPQSHSSIHRSHSPQAFILGTGVFCSSWLGSALLQLGEFIIHRLPLITHIYGASKQARQYHPVYALH